MVPLILYIIAIVLFILAAVGVPTPPRLVLGWLGLAFFCSAVAWPSMH